MPRSLSKFFLFSFTFLILSILIIPAAAHGPIVPDGSDSEWLSGFGSNGCPFLPTANFGTVYSTLFGCVTTNGQGREYIWTDMANDQRTDHWNGTGNLDLKQIRVTMDEHNLYMLLRFDQITDCAAAYVQIAINSSADVTGYTALPNGMNTSIGTVSAPDWYRVIDAGIGGGVGYWTSPLNRVADGIAHCSDNNDLWEISMPRASLGMVNLAPTYRFTVAIACNNSGAPCATGGSSNVMDTLTIIGPNTWDEVSDGNIAYNINPNFSQLQCDTFPLVYTLTGNTPAELRQAVECANLNGQGIIDLDGQVVTFTDAPYTSNMGALPAISANLTVQNGTITRSGVNEFRFFLVPSPGSLTLRGMTLSNGGGTNFFDDGGAIAAFTDEFVHIIDSTITNSVILPSYNGSAIYATGEVTIFNSVISGNSGGRGALTLTNGPVYIANTLITGNVNLNAGSGGSGAGLFISLVPNAVLLNTTIAHNYTSSLSATHAAGIGFGSGVDMEIRNSIIWGNRNANSSAPQYAVGSNTLTISDSVVHGGDIGGTNIITSDPLFVSPVPASSTASQGGSYILLSNSPAIDAGANAYVALDAMDVNNNLNLTEDAPDLAGLRRRSDSLKSDTGSGTAPIVDMGAYERQGDVIITESGGSTNVTEGGATDSYTVVLTGQPTSDVTITILSDAQTTVSPTSLVFTTANWNVAQSVTVTAVDDLVVEGTHGGSITHSAAGGGYSGVSIAIVTPNITDNDMASVNITPTMVNVTEGGATDSYTVVLGGQPVSDVTITILSDAQAMVSPTSLVFTTANWNVAQSVTVTAVDDLVAEGTHGGSITHSAAGGGYSGVSIAIVTPSITDNDTASVSITPTTVNVTEGGATDSYTAVLTSQPTSDVTVTILSDAQATVSPTSLIFTTSNWNVAQSVTVTAVDDLVAEGTHGGSITHSAAGGGYSAVSIATVTPNITDNDMAAVSITPTTVNVTEGGATDSYTAVLTSQPTSDVTITILSDAQATVSPTSLVFTTANWNVAQSVTVTAVDDLVAEGMHSGSITHSAAGGGYSAVSIATVTPNITDNDMASVSITPTTVNVTEGGATDSYTVVLTSQPTSDVTITILSDAQTTVSPTSLIFTTANWNVAQSVMVTAVDDAVVEDAHTGTITHSAADGGYAGVMVAGVTVNITDNDPVSFDVLINGSFEIAGATNKLAANWNIPDPTAKNRRLCENVNNPDIALDGQCAFRFKFQGPNNVNQVLKQPHVAPSWGNAGDNLTLTVNVAAVNLKAGAKLRIKVIYTDGTKGISTVQIPSGTYAYAPVSVNLMLEKRIRKATAIIRLGVANGLAYVDAAEMMVTPGVVLSPLSDTALPKPVAPENFRR